MFLLVVPNHRRELVRPGFYWLLLGFLPFLLAPIIWNQQHEWITLAHLSVRGGLQKPFAIHLLSFLRFLGGQFGVYSPLVFLAFLIAFFASIRKAFQNTKVCFLLTFSWPILLTYFFLALKQPGQPNWTAPAFISLRVPNSFVVAHFTPPSPPGHRSLCGRLGATCPLNIFHSGFGLFPG